LPALVFAPQSHYTGWQTVINNRTLGDSYAKSVQWPNEEKMNNSFPPLLFVSPWHRATGTLLFLIFMNRNKG
jgi:hypothetical protein